MSMKYNKLSFFRYITIFLYLLTLIFAAVYQYELFLFMLWNLKTHNRVPKQMSFCLLSSAVYSCCLHNVSTWIVKPCRTYLSLQKVSINLCSSLSKCLPVTLYLLLSSSVSPFTSFFLSFSLSHSLSLIFNLISSPHISTLLDTWKENYVLWQLPIEKCFLMLQSWCGNIIHQLGYRNLGHSSHQLTNL